MGENEGLSGKWESHAVAALDDMWNDMQIEGWEERGRDSVELRKLEAKRRQMAEEYSEMERRRRQEERQRRLEEQRIWEAQLQRKMQQLRLQEQRRLEVEQKIKDDELRRKEEHLRKKEEELERAAEEVRRVAQQHRRGEELRGTDQEPAIRFTQSNQEALRMQTILEEGRSVNRSVPSLFIPARIPPPTVPSHHGHLESSSSYSSGDSNADSVLQLQTGQTSPNPSVTSEPYGGSYTNGGRRYRRPKPKSESDVEKKKRRFFGITL